MAKASDATTPGGWFKVPNALIPHLATLTHAELSTWLTLARWRKDDGTAFGTAEWIAAEAGLTLRSVERALPSLTRKGFLLTVEPGRRGYAATRLVTVPSASNSPPTVAVKRDTDSPPKRARCTAKRRAMHRQNERDAPPPVADHSDLPLRLTTQTQQQQQPAAAAGAAAGAGHSEGEERRGARDALKRNGIGEPTRSKLLDAIPGLTGDDVEAFARGNEGGVGLLIVNLQADGAAVVAERQAAKARAKALFEANYREAVEFYRSDPEKCDRIERESRGLASRSIALEGAELAFNIPLDNGGIPDAHREAFVGFAAHDMLEAVEAAEEAMRKWEKQQRPPAAAAPPKPPPVNPRVIARAERLIAMKPEHPGRT